MGHVVVDELAEVHEQGGELRRRALHRRRADVRNGPGRRQRAAVGRSPGLRKSWNRSQRSDSISDYKELLRDF